MWQNRPNMGLKNTREIHASTIVPIFFDDTTVFTQQQYSLELSFIEQQNDAQTNIHNQ
jgi:hypothetical protein